MPAERMIVDDGLQPPGDENGLALGEESPLFGIEAPGPATGGAPDLAARGGRQLKVAAAALAGLAAVALLAYFALGRKQATDTAATPAAVRAAAPVQVTMVQAVSRDVPVFVEATGSVTPYETTDVAPQVSGLVAETRIEVGDSVRKGQVLARLDSRDAAARLKAAEAALGQAEANLAQARAKLGIVGGESFAPERVAEVESARAQKDWAEATETRFKSLLDSGSISRAQYDEAHAKAETARRQYEAALHAARGGGSGVEASTAAVEAARAQVALARKALEDTTVVAPIEGQVAERPAAAGEWVTPSNKIATIVHTGALKLQLTIPESDVSKIGLGMAVELTVESFPGRVFQGKVGAIVPSLDSGSRSLTAVVGLLNPDGALRPGMFVKARIAQPDARRTAVLLPREAVAQAGSFHRVFVVRDRTAEARVVQIRPADGNMVEVIGGLEAGEEVVLDGLNRVADGAEIAR